MAVQHGNCSEPPKVGRLSYMNHGLALEDGRRKEITVHRRFPPLRPFPPLWPERSPGAPRVAGVPAGSTLATASRRTASWPSAVEWGSKDRWASCIGLFISGEEITGRASPKTDSTQKVVEIRQHRERHARRAMAHPGASCWVEHLCAHDREDAVQHLDIEELSELPPFNALHSKTAAESVFQRQCTAATCPT